MMVVLGALPVQAQPKLATGLDNPTLALNVSRAHDWVPGMQFLDLMRSNRSWMGHKHKQYGIWKTADLQEKGFLDDQGWVKAVPEGLRAVGTAWNWSRNTDMFDYRKGRYVIRFKGTGKLRFTGDARVVSQTPGQIIIENREGKTWRFEITHTDLAKTGDYMRDISVVAERHLDLVAAGAVFNPDWLELIKDVRQVRFMEWSHVNKSHIRTWADMPDPMGPLLNNGHAVEHMVQLANEVGADAWFSMPHQSTDATIRRFAEYVRDHLDPRLLVSVEWSNELWNWGFTQTHWSRDQSEAQWGQKAHRDYAVKRAVETGLIWKDVFKDQPQRLQLVLASFVINDRYSKHLLEAPVWKAKEPSTYVPPAQVFDALAVTTYFGHGLTHNAAERADLMRLVGSSERAMNLHVYDRLRSADFDQSVPRVIEFLERQKAVADAYGLDLILYEGGQHVHHRIPNKIKDVVVPEADREHLYKAMENFVRSPEMAKLYQQLWMAWEEIGDGPFMQYSDIGLPTKFGSWGLHKDLMDTPPRAKTLARLNRTRAPWWEGAVAGPQYQQGVTTIGTAKSETLRGTPEEDYLIGGAGDDLFYPGGGRDGVHGGAGQDRAIYSQPYAAYDIRKTDRGVKISGPEGTDLLVSVEQIAFAGGQVLKTEDLR